MAEATQESERDVNFELSPDAVAILRRIAGFEDFDPAVEVLHMEKPGTGCKDAPRCWALQLAKATNAEYGAIGTLYDDELIAKHSGGELQLLATKHVDDVKVAGSDTVSYTHLTLPTKA